MWASVIGVKRVFWTLSPAFYKNKNTKFKAQGREKVRSAKIICFQWILSDSPSDLISHFCKSFAQFFYCLNDKLIFVLNFSIVIRATVNWFFHFSSFQHFFIFSFFPCRFCELAAWDEKKKNFIIRKYWQKLNQVKTKRKFVLWYKFWMRKVKTCVLEAYCYSIGVSPSIVLDKSFLHHLHI